jgi:hypothetical protein
VRGVPLVWVGARSSFSGQPGASFQSGWPMEAAGAMENACGVSHSPLDAAARRPQAPHLYDYYFNPLGSVHPNPGGSNLIVAPLRWGDHNHRNS